MNRIIRHYLQSGQHKQQDEPVRFRTMEDYARYYQTLSHDEQQRRLEFLAKLVKKAQ